MSNNGSRSGNTRSRREGTNITPEYLWVEEERRKVESCKNMVDEILYVLSRDFGIDSFKKIKRMVQEAKTYEEVRLAVDLLMVTGRLEEFGREVSDG